MNQTESFKDIPGYPGYSISSFGRVRSSRRNVDFLKPETVNNGYLRVLLTNKEERKHFLIHGLVLEAFIGPRPEDYVGNHKNGIKIDNRAENLEWVTAAENVRLALAMGLGRNSNLTRDDIGTIREEGRSAVNKIRLLAQTYGMTPKAILRILLRKTWGWI